ncbi:MAG: hypothetical protein QXU90_00475 [Acidilobaceae archaeon]
MARVSNDEGETVRNELKTLIEILRREGLTERQIEAGINYYLNFCKKHDINIAKSARMIVRMVKNMIRYYEGA